MTLHSHAESALSFATSFLAVTDTKNCYGPRKSRHEPRRLNLKTDTKSPLQSGSFRSTKRPDTSDSSHAHRPEDDQHQNCTESTIQAMSSRPYPVASASSGAAAVTVVKRGFGSEQESVLSSQSTGCEGAPAAAATSSSLPRVGSE